MKKIFILLIGLIGVSAIAGEPRLGDRMEMITVSYGGKKATEYLATYIVDSYDHKYDYYKVVGRFSYRDGIVENKNLFFHGEKLQETYYYDPIENCKALKGKIVFVSVIAGDFKACKVVAKTASTKLTKWFSNVPFLLVKEELEDIQNDGSLLRRRELLNYSRGEL